MRYAECQADRGETPTAPKILDGHTLKGILERYRDEVSVKKRSHNSEVFVINAFLKQPMANFTLRRLKTEDFAIYRDKRLKQVKPGTVNRELSIIKHALDIAVQEWGVPLRENPLAKIRKLRAENARNRRLEPEEWEALCDAATFTRNPLILPLVRFAIATGMRRGEILRLDWSEVDFKTRTLFIPITKNGHSRTIPLSPMALDVLNQLSPGQANHVFPLSDNAAKLAWQRLVERAGIKNLHFHDLRHEAISRFFEKGLSVPEVALISGHKDARMLFRYTHLKAEDVADKLHSQGVKT